MTTSYTEYCTHGQSILINCTRCEVEKLQKECDRYREALKKIVSKMIEGEWDQTLPEIFEIAHQAL